MYDHYHFFRLLRCLAMGVVLLSLLTACSNTRFTPTNSSNIPDAIPKKEPKSSYGNAKSYVVFGKRYYVMDSSKGYVEQGIASWYGADFHGKRTSSGETYNMYTMTAAHKSLPLPTYAKVTNLKNGKHIIVKINDRGPFHENRIIDLSYVAALKLGIMKTGTGLVEVRAIDPEEPDLYKQKNAVAAAQEVTLPTARGGFYIQVGAFSELSNAEALRQKLRPLGGSLVKISRGIVGGKIHYRVRIGPVNDIVFSDSIVLKLATYGVYEHHIVLN